MRSKLIAIALLSALALTAQYVPPGGGGGGGAPSGPAGGSLSGTYPNPGIVLPTGTSNCVVASPANGSSAAVACRSLVSADIPSNAANTTGSASKIGGIAVTGTPSTGQVPIATGATAATWQTAPGAGTGVGPVGPDTAVQFNNASALGGSALFSFTPATGVLLLGDESLIPPDIQGWWGSGLLYVPNSDPTINGLSIESVTNNGKAALSLVGYANAAGQQANGLSLTAYRASALATAGTYGINGGTYNTASGSVAYGNNTTNGFDGMGVVGTLSYSYYSTVSTDNGASVVTHYDFYANDLGGKTVTNPYYSWFDSRGVRRVKEDATFDSVGQAIEALYNPQFTKYTPGAANFERVVLGQWNGNVAEIGTEAGGTGTLRPLKLIGSTLTLGNVTPATTGVRFICISTAGVVTSQAVACVGT